MTAGKMNQAHRPAGSVEQSADRRAAVLPDDQVAFRKTEAGPGGPGVAEVALRFGRSLGMFARPSLGALTAN
jgi:hypothetical protein